tara:strand:- start:8266 stop:8469 length:204 start_codon:yes stop_codon:yes gene_type:complete
MTKNNIIENLTEEETAEMEDKAEEIRGYAIGLGLALRKFYDEYGLNEWQLIFEYLDVVKEYLMQDEV